MDNFKIYNYYIDTHAWNNEKYDYMKGIGKIEIFYYQVVLFNMICNLSGIFVLNLGQKYIPICWLRLAKKQILSVCHLFDKFLLQPKTGEPDHG